MTQEIPLFRTRTLQPAIKTPLPQQKMQTGIATFAEAEALQVQLAEDHYTALGKDETGYYVKAPSAALVAYLTATEGQN
jgi:hypothetical protein